MERILKEVDQEELFLHVLKLEGVKHPIESPEKLNEAADYIKSKFQEYGLETREHTFMLEGFDFPFRNIEGYLGDGSNSELLITSHYDTTATTPGADDNASAVAGMLETARVLSQEENVGNIRFVSFTMEEMNPVIALKWKMATEESGLFDEQNRSLTYHTQKMYSKYINHFIVGRMKYMVYDDAFQYAMKKVKDQINDQQKEFFEKLRRIYKGITLINFPGKSYLKGSHEWLEYAKKEKKKITGVINLEMIGFVSRLKKSQRTPSLLKPLFFPSYKINPFKVRGDFIAIASDKNSKKLGRVFFKQCKQESIKLPCLFIKVPLRYEKIAKYMEILLRSDHAPFWRANIPAIIVSDTSFLRYPFYHTQADTIDKLDFDFMKKVTQATVASTIEFSSHNT